MRRMCDLRSKTVFAAAGRRRDPRHANRAIGREPVPPRANRSQESRRATIKTVFAGDRDRERAAAALRDHYVRGRLSPEELTERIGHVLAARARGEIRHALWGSRSSPTWTSLRLGAAPRCRTRSAVS